MCHQARMGRPEKSAPREKPTVHGLFPIALEGGNQRLIPNASLQKEIRVQVGVRFCTKCERKSPTINCHHRKLDSFGEEKPGEICGGRTEIRKSSENKNSRRIGEIQTVKLENLLEDAMIQLARDARLYPGEGWIDFAGIIERCPPMSYSIELPNQSRLSELGFEEHARRCLLHSKNIFKHFNSKRIPTKLATG